MIVWPLCNKKHFVGGEIRRMISAMLPTGHWAAARPMLGGIAMTRMTAKDFDQDLLDLYEFYAHGMITKREFLDRAGAFAVALLDMPGPDYATTAPEMPASVPFYGRQAGAEDVPKIQAPLLHHYAGLDARINGGWPDYEAALKANNKTHEVHIYPDVNHGFCNDSTPRYDEASAELAWSRTIDWFSTHLA